VRDDDDRTVLLDGVDAVLDLLGGDGVEAGRRLVEEDDGRVTVFRSAPVLREIARRLSSSTR